jgi:N-acyl-L-homoserine lactone synthetase
MIIVVEKYNADKYLHLLDQMFRLRARVFRDKMGWNVNVVDGMERDLYDDLDPAYMLYTDEEETIVKGSLRLLPTTGRTLISDVFSDTVPDAAFLSAPEIWECTRLCFDTDLLRAGSREDVLLASGILLEGLGSVALKAGITTVLGNFAPAMLRVYRRIGCEVEVLGVTRRYGNPVYLGAFPVSDDHLANVRRQIQSLRSDLAPRPEELAA